ncbi:MAG TPA: lipopolysaccharide biosynthesis protein [Casimicrobiaceae bacterium]|nr:lipopolysaccharide biosynthesis protein [Casimicrobiaceae bacterium]
MRFRLFGRDPRIMRACLSPTTNDLSGRVVRGAAWMGTLVVTRALLTLGATAILARLLTPADYGYVAMAAVVTEFAAALCVFGLPAIIVQTPRLRRLDLDSAFWFSVILGVGIAALLIACSRPIADLFLEPRLAPILCATSTLILFEEVSAVHQSIVYRLLLFRYEFICQLAALLVGIATSISLAVAGYGVWSLVWGSVSGRAAHFLLLWYLIPYVPRLRFGIGFIRRNVRVGGSYFGLAALNIVTSRMDTTTVGRAFGATELGYYQTAFALPEELRSRISLALQRVLFPAYARLQSDHRSFQEGVLQSLRVLAAITMPMGVGLAVLADLIVRTLYGEQWLPVVPLLQVIAIIGVTRALYGLLANIYKAKGRPDLDFKIGVGLVPLLLVAIIFGTQWGTLGVAIGVLVFNVVLLGSAVRALQLIELDPFDALAAVAPAACAAGLMGAMLVALDAMDLMPRSTPALELLVLVPTGAVLFFAALFAISRSSISELWSMRRFLRAN